MRRLSRGACGALLLAGCGRGNPVGFWDIVSVSLSAGDTTQEQPDFGTLEIAERGDGGAIIVRYAVDDPSVAGPDADWFVPISPPLRGPAPDDDWEEDGEQLTIGDIAMTDAVFSPRSATTAEITFETATVGTTAVTGTVSLVR